ncbi:MULTISPECIES: Na+/H+ antiporter NhaC family protein [unclassified Butyrivibrio]|uniref:Na+/H+ antiporter NhaC family protein n=1 Tax=unclassified Butyrivibrio TaxID=2639466 RepID=UPI0003B5DCFC|nr:MULTISPECIES: Na+/H+ antiporter NhaC family protein [unclassified Butyrivibrio]MDC7293007.1 Na+/H+ antiporter NhaC family protein [Butyrivibrio sp. DSM 10294]
MFANSFWALLPAIIAITLALITKEVYSSLFIGIVVGGLLYSSFSIEGTIQHVFVDGMIAQLSDGWNVGILIFLVILGAMVMLMNRAGGSAAFGRWAVTHVKTKAGAQVATIVLGMLIFIDDYFNCLTVGSVMRPLTDKHKISREKLAYLIDATAAPVCIIAPISSWAAAVTGFVDGANGLTLFVRAIPYNFYAILTIVMMFSLTFSKFDYGPMRQAEHNQKIRDAIQPKDSYASSITGAEDQPAPPISQKGKVIHLVLPIVSLIICCVIGMIYTGGFFSGETFIDAFSGSDASVGLVYGSVVALIITIIFYLATKVLNFNECMNAIPEGFKSMVPAILVLTFAWTLKAMTDSLGAKEYVAGIVENMASSEMVMSLLPAIIFVIAVFLAFATGTSWGTFGILIPIVVSVFDANLSNELMIISISACMAGAVCGDHCSPISDTTIMASAGAQCDHIKHVSTQLPYAMTTAIVSFVAYFISGFVRSWYICMPIGIALMVLTVMLMRLVPAFNKD